MSLDILSSRKIFTAKIGNQELSFKPINIRLQFQELPEYQEELKKQGLKESTEFWNMKVIIFVLYNCLTDELKDKYKEFSAFEKAFMELNGIEAGNITKVFNDMTKYSNEIDLEIEEGSKNEKKKKPRIILSLIGSMSILGLLGLGLYQVYEILKSLL